MFKKLKQKIEEGGGEDRPPAFSPRKLPGSVIRSVPPDSNDSSEYGAKVINVIISCASIPGVDLCDFLLDLPDPPCVEGLG